MGRTPFTVLDTRQGYWQERRRWWADTGLDSNVGREHLTPTANASEGLYSYFSGRGASGGGSTFDPCWPSCWWAGSVAWANVCWTRSQVDPAGGVVAGVLGRRYTGIDVRDDQVQANRAHWQQLQPSLPALRRSVVRPDHQPEHTPVQQVGQLWLKRDDLYSVAGVAGGKVRSCWALAQGARGLVTAGSRASPQVTSSPTSPSAWACRAACTRQPVSPRLRWPTRWRAALSAWSTAQATTA